MLHSKKRRSPRFQHSILRGLTRLEERAQPSVTAYTPPSNYWANPDLSAVDPRMEQQPPLTVAMTYLNAHAAEFGATPADLVNPIVTSQYTDADTGIAHLYLRQQVGGLEVANADLSIGVAANGAIISIGGGFVPNLKGKIPALRSAAMSPTDAVKFAAAELNLTLSDPPELIPEYGPSAALKISAPSISTDDITAKLHFVPTADGSAVLAWELIVQTPDGLHWYDLSVDAFNGQVVALSDWIDNDSYNAVVLPNDSPVDGGFSIGHNPANATASPFGWHDNNGVAGGEFTDTRGNNVDAHLDRNADNVADSLPVRPDGGAARDFGFYTFNAALAPATLQNENAAVVNLFDLNNRIHDIHYQYGFTEAAGNFQTNNYGKGGSGNDAVQADAQDGSGTNNANFGTPADGSAPRMQMFEWTGVSPSRDSDLDNGIIIHEYAHGVSNRLTGGPTNPNALNNIQSGGMGEGWGDFYGLMFEQRATDAQNGAHGVGTYVLGQPITGLGIRRFRYSFDMGVNPLTWDAYGTTGTTPYGVTRTTQVHRSGEIWASALWDLNWLLINKYGYDPHLQTGWTAGAGTGAGKAGNKLTLRLVMEAMKLQPANPSFLQARDAIIAADNALNGGADLFEIWTAFARRGLGFGASTPDSASTDTPVLSTVVPMLVSGATPANTKVVATSPTSYVLTVTAAIDPATLDAADLKVNGQPATSVSYTSGETTATFTFATDPVAAEGPQAIAVAASAFTRASDSSAVGAFSSAFFVDSTPLLVTSITPVSGSIVTLPFATIDVNLNGEVNPASVSNADLNITQGTVTGFTLLNGNTTVRFTIGNLVGEGVVNVGVAAGAFADPEGNPNATFAGSLNIDYGTFAFPTPLVVKNPVGALIYEGSFSAAVGYAGDSDSFTLNLDAGQKLNVSVVPNPNLRPSITVTGPGTNVSNSAPANGSTALVQNVTIATAGMYTFAVGGLASTLGAYSVAVSLNTTNEIEFNDSFATAQNLTSSFIDLGAGAARASVRGRSDSAVPTVEAEPNNAIANATPVTLATGTPTNLYQLDISGANSSTTDSDYFTIGTMQVGDVITFTNSGTYSLRGTQPDAIARIYRNNGGSPILLISDDDGGPHDTLGGDGLIYRYTVATADTYMIRASRANAANVGSYQLAVLLENTGAAPTTGGTFAVEVEPNDTTTTPNNASTSWTQVKYLVTSAGTITAGDTDLFAYNLTAGNEVALVARSTSALSPQAALLDSAGNVLATENGTSLVAGAGGFSPIYDYLIPTTGTYYFRVTGASGSTGSYAADLYLSTSATLGSAPLGRDYYSFALTAGQSATLALKNLSTGNIDLSILDPGGVQLGIGSSGPTNVDEILNNFVAPVSGTYFAQITGVANVDYQLTVVTGGTFDAEANDTFATAQALGAGSTALGTISGNNDWYQLAIAAGNTITVSTTTPGGGTGEFTNMLDPLIELYDPSNTLVSSDDNSGSDGRNATLTHVATATGNYRVRINGAAATSGEYVLNAAIVTVAPPRVSGVVVGAGAQRSIVSSLTINFDSAVTLPVNPAGAFTLTRQGGGTVALAGVAVNSPNTSVTLTFTGGSVDAASLADGRYTLTALASQITVGGAGLDGNGDGTAGDDYILVGDLTNKLFRLFGDADGDGDNDTADFVAFRTAFGAGASVFDSEGDGDTDIADFTAFRLRFGTII